MIVALPGLFSYLFFLYIDKISVVKIARDSDKTLAFLRNVNTVVQLPFL